MSEEHLEQGTQESSGAGNTAQVLIVVLAVIVVCICLCLCVFTAVVAPLISNVLSEIIDWLSMVKKLG